MLADEIAAMIASVIIAITAVRIARVAFYELLDGSAAELSQQVKETASRVEGVQLVEKVHARKSGQTYHVDMHVHVAPEMSVQERHALSGKVKAVVKNTHARVRQVLIHIEPGTNETGKTEAGSVEPKLK